MARMTAQSLLPSLLPSGKVKPSRPKGFFRDSRKTDQKAAVLDYKGASKLSIGIAWKSWTRFCEEELPEDDDDQHDPVVEADRVDKEIDVSTVRAFLSWLLSNGNFRQLDAVMSYCRHWRMACRHHLQRRIDDRIAKDMKAHIHSHLKEEYELSEMSQFRATMNNDDVLAVLYHHWAVCKDYYPTERQRLQHALLILLCAGTSARPGTLIEGGGYYDENDALTYGDIKAHVVKDPEDPQRKSVVMLITLRLMKGYRNRGAPPTFVFYERPETPSFCVVSHILGLAFDDDAFLSQYIRDPKDIWAVNVPSHRQGTPIEWKSSMAEKPLLRRSVRTATGVTTSPTKAAQFTTMSKYNIRLGRSAGLEKPFRFYTLRRGAGQAINKNATEPERMQAMGHADPDIYRRHYLNQIVTTDTLACFLGAPSREGIMRLASHMSLTRDVNAPTALSRSQVDELRTNPVLSAAQANRDLVRSKLIKQHSHLKVAREADPSGYAQHQRLQKAAKAVEMKLRRRMLTAVRERFFASAGARYIEQQNAQSCRVSEKLDTNTDDVLAATILSVPEFEITERNAVQELLFQAETSTLREEGRDAADLCDVVRAFRALCLRSGRPSKPSEVHFESLAEEEICHNERFPETFPIVVPGTVCLFCLGNVSLTASARTYAYARRSSLARHVQQHHLQYQQSEFLCPHPTCSAHGVQLLDGMHFKNHAATVHNVVH